MSANAIYHKLRSLGVKEWISLAALIIPAALLAYVWAIAPVVADDLMYTSRTDHYVAEGRGFWAGILAELQLHAQCDNIRLANISYLLTYYLLPRPVVACIMAVIFSAGIWVFTRIVAGSLRTPVIVCTLLFVNTYILQWLIVLSHDYLFNYLPTVMLAGIVVHLFLHLDTLSPGKRKLLYALALILGLWHECGALPTLLALTVYMLVTRKATKAQLTVCGLLFLGVALCFSVPGPWVRLLGTSESGSMPEFRMNLKHAIALISVPVAAWIYVRERRKGGVTRPDTPLICLCAAGLAGGLILFFILHIYPRANYCGFLFGASAIILICRRLFNGKRIARQWWLSLPLLTVIIVHCTFFAITATDAIRVYNRAERQFIASDQDFIFCDLGPVRHLPSIWQNKMSDSEHMLLHASAVMEWTCIHHKGHSRFTIFFPRELRDVDIAPGEKVAGDNSLYRKGDVLYIPYNDTTAHLLKKRFWWNEDKGKVLELNSDTVRTPRGYKLIYLSPHDLTEEIPHRIQE